MADQPEIDVDALLKQLRTAMTPKKEKKQANKKDVTKALALFKKSKASFENAVTSLDVAIGLLEGNDEDQDAAPKSDEYHANVEKHPEAPYGRRTNGLPKAASGKQAVKLRQQQAAGGDLFTSEGGDSTEPVDQTNDNSSENNDSGSETTEPEADTKTKTKYNKQPRKDFKKADLLGDRSLIPDHLKESAE